MFSFKSSIRRGIHGKQHSYRFCRAGAWPVVASNVFNVNRPANASLNTQILTVGQFEREFGKKREAFRDCILGIDAVMIDNDYVETTYGCVVTSNNDLSLVREKQDRNKHYSTRRNKSASKESTMKSAADWQLCSSRNDLRMIVSAFWLLSPKRRSGNWCWGFEASQRIGLQLVRGHKHANKPNKRP